PLAAGAFAVRTQPIAAPLAGLIATKLLRCAVLVFSAAVAAASNTMAEFPPCPQCNSTLTYEDGPLYVCPECAHEWSTTPADESSSDEEKRAVRDAVGNELQDGDTVTV